MSDIRKSANRQSRGLFALLNGQSLEIVEKKYFGDTI